MKIQLKTAPLHQRIVYVCGWTIPDLHIMQVLHSQKCLSEKVAHFRLSQGLSSLVEFHEGASAAQLQQDIHVILVLKEAMKSDHMGVTQRSMDVDLHGHLDMCVV